MRHTPRSSWFIHVGVVDLFHSILALNIISGHCVMEDDYLLSSNKSAGQQRRGFISKLWHTDWCPWVPARYVLALMTFLGIVNVYALRVNLSMALVVMVNDSDNQADADIQPHPVSTCTQLIVLRRLIATILVLLQAFVWTDTQQGTYFRTCN